ncbi:MAG TPA: ABC transporter ATP-binding protein, partial [Anaerolineales bacterium]|nr:ABC transporter ATP-binding protein [Anaerolineales bacterium]
MITPVLQIENLTVAYRRGGEWLEAVREVSFHVHAGETFGLVGESGSGKTTLVLAVMRYLGENGVVKAGGITLAGRDLLALNPVEMEKIWGKQIALVPQNPGSSLNPSMRIGEQLAEVLRHHFAMDAAEANHHALDWFERVHLPDPDRVANSYPHQVSAGMQQRVLIATALCTEPGLLILDEPTSSLDVTTQAVILDLVRELIRGRQTAVLYVTHNLGVVAQVCDRVGVLYAGEFVEQASARELFSQPLHPYTQGMLASVPLLGKTKERVHLRAIPGQIPPLGELPGGCVFRPRCQLAVQICETRPPLYVSSPDRIVRCHRWAEIQKGQVGDWQLPAVSKMSEPAEDEHRRLVLNLDALQVHYPRHRSLQEALLRQPARKV